MSGALKRLNIGLCTVAAITGLGLGNAGADGAGQGIAEKFARPPAQVAPARANPKPDEQDLLDRVRRETGDSKAVTSGAIAPQDMKSQEAQREDELKRLSEKLRRASLARAPRTPAGAPATVTPPWTTEVVAAPKSEIDTSTRSALGARPAEAGEAERRVTVLMVMTPGSRGIRRYDKSADPILCAWDGCYVSRGAGAPAQFLPLKRAFGFANTYGQRAGDCSHQLGCVFRGVDLAGNAPVLQPVDIRMIHHDRREMKSHVAADTSCRSEAGRLSCSRPLRGEDYTMWVVPESVAQKAGTDALQRAVAEGLVTTRSAELPWQAPLSQR